MRKKIFVTQNLTDFNRNCERLAAKGVPFTTKVSDRSNATNPLFIMFGPSHRARTGTLMERDNLRLSYAIFTEKQYVEQALYVIQQNGR